MTLLETIYSPADLRALPAEQLPALADELRTFLLTSVARTGGHLSSNLGTVELTLALHTCSTRRMTGWSGTWAIRPIRTRS